VHGSSTMSSHMSTIFVYPCQFRSAMRGRSGARFVGARHAVRVLHSPAGHAFEGQHCPTSAAFTIYDGHVLFVPGINFTPLSTLPCPTCVRTICNMSSAPFFDYFSLNTPFSNATEQFSCPDAPDTADALDGFFGVDLSEAACMVSGPTIWFPD
jgi:hypothetical protein